MRTKSLTLALLIAAAGSVAAHAENMIDAQGLKATPSSVTVGTVAIDKMGYIVIHESKDGKPGPILGHEMIEAGKSEGITVKLDQQAKAGSELIVMLHSEGDADKKFDAKGDPPVMSGGKIVMESVKVQ